MMTSLAVEKFYLKMFFLEDMMIDSGLFRQKLGGMLDQLN